MESSNTEKPQTRSSLSRSFHANESEVLHGRQSLGGQHLYFNKRIRELETELDTIKHSQVIFTQHKVIAERDLTVARLNHKISEQDLFIKTLSRELNNFGEGSSLLEKINQLLHKLEQSEEDQRTLQKKVAYFEALAAEGYLPSADFLTKDQDHIKRQAELESELRAKNEDLRIMEKRLNELKENRNELSEYTMTLEEKIKKYEDDKSTNSEGIIKKDQIIEKLEDQLSSLEQTSKDVEDYFLQQINRKTTAMQNEIKDLENKLKLQAIAKDERVEALNIQLQDQINKFEQLKKEYTVAKEKNDELANITQNFDAKVLEVTDKLTAKFRRTEEELREKMSNLAREKAALEQMLSEACIDTRPSISVGISFEDEMRNLEEFRPSWVHVNTNVDELNSRIGQLKLEIIEKDRIIEETQAEAENYRRALLDRDSSSDRFHTSSFLVINLHANESEVLQGRVSVGDQHLDFTKRISELESELNDLKHSQVLFTQDEAIAERDLTLARLQHDISEQDLLIKSISHELNNFGEGSSLLEKINYVLLKLNQSEEDQRILNIKLANFEAQAAEDQDHIKRQAELERELRSKHEELSIIEKQLKDSNQNRNELLEYTMTLEEKIKKYEDDKSTNSEGVIKRDQIIQKLENQLSSLEQSSKDELNLKITAMKNEIEDLENKLTLQASAKDEQVEALNIQIRNLMNEFEHLKKEYDAAKEKNDELAKITQNFDAKMLEVSDALTAKFRESEEEFRERIQNLSSEKTALEQMLSEACVDKSNSIARGISYEDEIRNLNANIDELKSSIGKMKLEIIEKDRIIEQTQATAEGYRRALVDRDSSSGRNDTSNSIIRSFPANEVEVLHGRLSLGGQHLHFTKRIRELETELDTLKHSQYKIIAERDLTVAKLHHDISKQELLITSLSRELNNFGEGSSLIEKINKLLHKLEQSEEDQRSLKKKVAYFEALAAEGYLPSPDILTKDQDHIKRQAELESELRVKDDDLRIMEKRLNELKENRNELSEYTARLEEKIKKFEDDKTDYSGEIKEKDQIIEKLEDQLFSIEQSSKDEQDFFFQQLNRKTTAMQNEIKDLENKLKLQAIAKDERVEALNIQLQDQINKFEQLKKEYTVAKEKNDELANITQNFDAKVLEVTDKLAAKFRRTEEELREKISNLAREKAALEQMLSEARMDTRPSISVGISFEDELRNLEEVRPSWIDVNYNADELNSRIGHLKLEIKEKDRIIEEAQADAENYRRALLDRDRLIQLHNKERENSKEEVAALNLKIVRFIIET
jgi:chromosome segregation ATPase